jgi:hypothetical protein
MTGLKEQIRRIEKGLEKHKKKKTKGMHFTSATREEIESKIGANDPWLSGLGFDDRTTPGGTVNIQVFIDNPGLAAALNLYVHVWIGSGIADPSGDTFVPNVDTRFPRLTEPHFPGLFVNAQSDASLYFKMEIPATVERTHYFVCYCLVTFGGWLPWKVFDRKMVVIEVA